MYPIPNGVRDKTILLYTSEIVDKKEILHTLRTTGFLDFVYRPVF
jgi:hypothetical protein